MLRELTVPAVLILAWLFNSAHSVSVNSSKQSVNVAVEQRAAQQRQSREVASIDEGEGLHGPGADAVSTDASALPHFDLMIVIPAHAKLDLGRRQTIRASWGQYLNASSGCQKCNKKKIKLLFVVGQEGDRKKIKDEAATCKDVGILDDFRQDSYNQNAAEKTQRSIRYAVENFRFRLLLKTETHSWIFIDRMVEFLDQQRLFNVNASVPGVYAGNFTPSSNLGTSWHNAQNTGALLDGTRVYPDYATGTGYVLSPDLCEFISGMGARSEDTSGAPKWGEDYGWAPVPRLLALSQEDMAVGFWLQVVNHTKVSMPVYDYNSCDEQSALPSPVIDDNISEKSMQERWAAYMTTGDPCSWPQKQNTKEHKALNFLA